jgi:hypothetical protein
MPVGKAFAKWLTMDAQRRFPVAVENGQTGEKLSKTVHCGFLPSA